MAGKNTTLGGGGFHHVAIKVRDFDRTLKMYTEGLGFVPKITWGEKSATGDTRAAMLDTGDGNYLEVFAGGPTPPHATVGPMAAAGPFFHIALRTANCDAATARAVAAGFTLTVPTKDVNIPSTPGPTPIRISFVSGPDGEVLEFFQNSLT